MSNYDSVFDRAREIMESGTDLDSAIKLWDHLLRELPADSIDLQGERAILYLNKALCLAELGRSGEAAVTAETPLQSEAPEVADEVLLQLLLVVMEQWRSSGDLGKARVAGERVQTLLEEEAPMCSHQTLVAVSQERAALAREMGKPDDAEDTLQTALELLDDELADEKLDPETAEELLWSKAKIFETRAHNRFEGHADEIARLDLEDALNIYDELLGSEHEETLRLKELLDQVSGNY
jgi:hypothetical protein